MSERRCETCEWWGELSALPELRFMAGVRVGDCNCPDTVWPSSAADQTCGEWRGAEKAPGLRASK